MDESYLLGILGSRSDLPAVSRDIGLELQRIKENIHRIIIEKKINLKPLKAENDQLSNKAQKIEKRLAGAAELLSGNILDDVEACSKTIETSFNNLVEMQLTLLSVTRLIKLHEFLSSSKVNMKNKQYYSSSQSLKNAEDVVKTCEDLKEINLFKALSRELIIFRESLLYDMSSLWKEIVNFEVDRKTDFVESTVSVNLLLSSQRQEIVQTLYFLNDTTRFTKFFEKIKDELLIPLIQNDSVISVKTSDDFATLTVRIIVGNEIPHYVRVFERIITVIEFIKTYFNADIPDHGDFIELMGQSIGCDIGTCVKNSLSEAIPSKPEQLESYGEIVANAEIFQEKLQKLGFLPDGCSSFLDDAAAGNPFFANKIYLSFLDRARTIMKKDLYNTIKSKEIASPDWHLFPAPVSKTVREHFNIGKRPILMESCPISKSAYEVMDLVEAIVNQLIKSNEARGIRLLYTVRNIFEIYSAVVPLHHKKLLETIPQQVALFHNNCIHFSYQLLVFAAECRSTWPNCLRDHYHVFLDQAAALRQLAVNSLESCVTNQRCQVLAILHDSGLIRISQSHKLDPTAEKSVRQCIRQLQLLRNVWADILPESVFANSMGFLVDEVTQAIVKYVTDAEDISADAAKELVQIFTIVDDRLPKLFNEPKEIHRLCRKWSRFNEMVFVLSNNLDSFSERWASGCGPLAVAFTKKEAQGLVRALFRNTERRAIVLSQIYNSQVD